MTTEIEQFHSLGLKKAEEPSYMHKVIHVASQEPFSFEDVAALAKAFNATHYWPRDGFRRFALIRVS